MNFCLQFPHNASLVYSVYSAISILSVWQEDEARKLTVENTTLKENVQRYSHADFGHHEFQNVL